MDLNGNLDYQSCQTIQLKIKKYSEFKDQLVQVKI